jgi:hypothetical protein
MRPRNTQCICRNPDARLCFRLGHRGLGRPPDGRCGCACHPPDPDADLSDDPARYRIWWTDGAEAKLAMVVEGLVVLHPDLEAAIRSRRGRAGRMRLWDSGGIRVPAGLAESWPMDGPIAAAIIAEDCGGVVFHQALLEQVWRMPGFVTTMRLGMS